MERLISDALASSAKLLTTWRKQSPFGGYGWHELMTSDHAGAHASCAALQLIAHPRFPIPDDEKARLVRECAIEFLGPLLVGHQSQTDEANHSTVKVANLLSTCAAIGRNPNLGGTFAIMVELGRTLVAKIESAQREFEWGHWLDGADTERRSLATATAVDALHQFAAVDVTVRERLERPLQAFQRRVFEEFVDLTARPLTSADILILWQRLPLLRSIARFERLASEDEDSYRAIFNAYLSRDVFSWGLTNTEDFQKFNSGRPSGTDYVSFNTTACLVSAIISAVEQRKLDLAFFDWCTPFLRDWALCIQAGNFPTPTRFSYIHQAIRCLQEAVDLHSVRAALPKTTPMNINPTVFQDRSFAVKPNQVFYATPFDFQPYGCGREQFEAYINIAVTKYAGDTRNLKLVAGDHNFTGAGVMARIWQHINESAVMIAVCFGANSNVYYEIGVAHTLGKPVLLLGRAGEEKNDIKFDLQGVRYEVLKDILSIDEVQRKVHGFLGEALRS